MNQDMWDASAVEGFVDPSSGTVDWWGLEQAAFAGHPQVQAAISEAVDELDRAPERFLVTRGLLLLLLEIAPVLGFGLGVIAVRWGILEGVPGAVLAAAVTLVYIGYQLVLRRWVARDLREVDGRRVMFIWINSSLFLLPMTIVFGTAAADAFGRSPEWVVFAFAAVVMIVAIAVALGTAASIRRIGAAHTKDDMEQALKMASAVERSRAAVEAMSEADRAAVMSRIEAAVRQLQALSVIDPHIADEALSQPLGALGRWEFAMCLRAAAQSARSGKRSTGRR